MSNLLEHLKEEFISAPLWQKVVLLALLAVLVFYFTLFPLFHFSFQYIRTLESRRDSVSGRLRYARNLMQDEQVLIKSYNDLKQKLARELSTKNTLQDLVRPALDKNAVRVYELTWGQQWQKDYNGLAIIEVNINARVLEKDIQALLDELLAPAYSRAESLNYLDNVLTAKIHYLVRY